MSLGFAFKFWRRHGLSIALALLGCGNLLHILACRCRRMTRYISVRWTSGRFVSCIIFKAKAYRGSWIEIGHKLSTHRDKMRNLDWFAKPAKTPFVNFSSTASWYVSYRERSLLSPVRHQREGMAPSCQANSQQVPGSEEVHGRRHQIWSAWKSAPPGKRGSTEEHASQVPAGNTAGRFGGNGIEVRFATIIICLCLILAISNVHISATRT